MGEYAEYQLQLEMRRGVRDNRNVGPVPRNPVAACCPVCGKGIRPIAGRIEVSMAQHMNSKHKERKDND